MATLETASWYGGASEIFNILALTITFNCRKPLATFTKSFIL